MSSESRALEDVQTAGKILEARQQRPVNAKREPRDLRRRHAERYEVAFDELGASAQGEPEGWLSGCEPCDVALYGNVEAVECLENAAILVHVETGIQQTELGLETSMHPRSFAF